MADDEFYELRGETLSDEAALTLPRTKAIAAAARRNRDFTVEKYARLGGDGNTTAEFIVMEVKTRGVPSKNAAGIKYRERIAVVVRADPKVLVNVWALRKAFPRLLHQNRVGPNAPADLCLYFEPVKAVLREWTPETFLRRIQWWLENSAKGTLHAADQPVEQLFFIADYELVLPWNFDELRKKEGGRFSVVPGMKLANGRLTLRLVPNAGEGLLPVSLVQLDLPPVIQGEVMPEPATLGELQGLLEGRGLDLLAELKALVQPRVGHDGALPTSDEEFTLVLLNIPVKRTADVEPERTRHQAFVLAGSLLELGEKLGVLMKHAGRYFQDVLRTQPADAWKSVALLTSEVLQFNSAKAARAQSGITEPGPEATLIGVGSLGSLLASLWGRMGWGKWTVIDKDHVKPHNLSRHIAMREHVGLPKTAVVRALHVSAMLDASIVTDIEADACEFTNDKVAAAIDSPALVVDASTTLEYPRAVSSRDGAARHASVFLTPNGRDSVLQMEDAARKLRLRTLEAQYYRALIRNDFGKDHLAGNASTFWSGASCRDISAVMPYSLIMTHAGSLADQVRQALSQAGARIRIWQRDGDTGQVTVHDVQAEEEGSIDLGEMKLFMDAGVERRLRAMRAAKLPNETGGVLLGYYDFIEKMVVIVDALPEPPDSKASPTGFERGKEDLAPTVEEAMKRTAGNVKYVGEWHSHPRGHSTTPSIDDRVQMAHLSLEMSSDGLPVLQLIVGDTDIFISQGEVR
ncbi:ThiF family adenylyltransferase [Roseateles sp. BYS78W]|uniref:ThiF family adenylyltransferase n=1 Tax=Pelomonas candidula TaxID=3299025 RepID=A0ABW7HLL3_9BURK